MKLLFISTLLFLQFTFSFGNSTPASVDVARVYCVKARITLKNGITMERFFTFGSYSMEVLKDSAGYYYGFWANETHTNYSDRLKAHEENDRIVVDKKELLFSQRLLSLTYDTLYLHKAMKVIRINYNENHRTRIAVPFGSAEKIVKQNIASLTVLTMTDLSYDGMTESKLQLDDETWVKNNYTASNMLGLGAVEMCSYEAIVPKAPDAATTALMKRLEKLYTEDRSMLKWPEVQKRDKEKEQLIEQLRKQKIIVISYCSC